MDNTRKNPAADAAVTDKKSYSKPTLAVLGSVKQLTQTGSSTKADGTAMMR